MSQLLLQELYCYLVYRGKKVGQSLAISHSRDLARPQQSRVRPSEKEARKQWPAIVLSLSHSSVQQCKADIRMSDIIIADDCVVHTHAIQLGIAN